MLRGVEPVTHLLTGACLSRACNFPARARYATAACVIAAELPDADFVYRLGGPLTYFQHHRGWTHALWSLPLQAALVTAAFVVVHNTRHIWKKHRSTEEPTPARWVLLWLMTLAALCSHVALDWTNNYGVRPFAPFNAHWFVGGLFFIVEPIALAALALALLVPFGLSMMHREAGIRRFPYPGRIFAAIGMLVMLVMLVVRGFAHADAMALAAAQRVPGGELLRWDVSPYPNTSETWHTVLETVGNLQSGKLDMKSNTYDIDPGTVFAKRPDTPFVTAAKSSWLGHVYLDWSEFPVVVDAGPVSSVHPGLMLSPADAAAHVIRFSDERFRYDTVLMHGATGKPPLGAEAWIGSDLHVRRIYMGEARQALP